jgi:hypothetical protein
MSMTFLQVRAQGHHGYPQPEDHYYASVYTEFCLRCGIRGPQKAPFRLKRLRLAPHSAFLQLNWVFDAFFVSPEVAEDIAASGIQGISFLPVLDDRSGGELAERRQLLAGAVIRCVETSRLRAVTCRPDNEESQWKITAGRTSYGSSTPYCGSVKYHLPASVGIRAGTLDDVPALFQTAEWFGLAVAAQRIA